MMEAYKNNISLLLKNIL